MSSQVVAFDSTDKILDEIDAKLNRVIRPLSTREVDVNEDPGIDLSSIRQLRYQMELQSSDFNQSKIPKFTAINLQSNGDSIGKEKNGVKTFHEKRTNLLQVYDDDINLLRKMLQENADKVADEKSLQLSFSGNTAKDTPTPPPQTCIPADVGSEKKNQLGMIDTIQPHAAPEFEPCLYSYEEELEKLIKERDELRARIRRGEASRTSIEERQELERQLHSSKAALFQQQKKSRKQLEDIEEKLEEAQHYYDERLAEKDKVIDSLQEQIELLQVNLSQQEKTHPFSSSPPPPPRIVPTSNNRLERELTEKTIEIKRLSDLISKKDQYMEELKSRLEDSTIQDRRTFDKELILERSKWESKMKSLQSKSDEEMREKAIMISRLEAEKEKIRSEVSELSQKLEEIYKEFEAKENKAKMDALQKEADYKDTIELLKNKMETLKEELSLAFSSKSEMELEYRRKKSLLVQECRGKEKDIKEENHKLQEELQQMKVEVAQAVAKLKDFKIDIDKQDQSLAASIYDECDKLSNLLQSIQSSTNINRKTYTTKGVLVCKRAVCELQDVVGSITRSVNDLMCDVALHKREARKKIEFSSYRNDSDGNVVGEDIRLLRDKLNKKEMELQELQINMTQWKDLTAQRLAEKFQEELQVQVERKLAQHRAEIMRKSKESKLKPSEIGRFSKSTNNIASKGHNGDSSTVKLLCHLQGRVKQLRTENDLLRSSNYIKGLDGR